MTTHLRIGLLGGFTLTSAAPGPLSLGARQQGLLACLVIRGSKPIARQELASLLWPESTDAQALTNLRRELHHLRRVLPDAEGWLDAESRTVAWRGSPRIDVDVASFEAAVTDGLAGRVEALHTAARLYAGDLLPGCDDEWIQPERDRLRRRAIEALGRLIDELERDRSYGEAIAHAERLVELDPLNEAGWRALMRCHAARGQHALALHAYQTCTSVLKREVGAPPSVATRLAYRELVESGEAELGAPQPAADAPSVPPLIGRRAEWTALETAWIRAAAGQFALVIVRGEAGIGKTRLVEELADWCGRKGVRVAATRCYAGEGRLAYAPVAAWLRTDALRAGVSLVDEVWRTEAARVQPELLADHPELVRPEPPLESWQRRRLFEGLARAVRAASPLLLILDDIQWCDCDTIEWLHFLLHFDVHAPCLVVATERAENEGDNPTLNGLLRELKKSDRLTVIELGPLDAEASLRLAQVVGGSAIDEDARTALARHSAGHPLFIVEAARMAGPQAGAEVPLPPRVQALVAARLEELSPPALALAELAAVIGRDFTFDLLAAAADLDEETLVTALDELWRRRVVRETAASGWDFTHDRIREVAYARIGPARRRLLHRRVAQAIELVFASALDAVSVAVASQLEQAHQPARAVEFFERAAHVAIRLCASEEAIRCFKRALSVLLTLPASRDRDRDELRLRRALCGPLGSARGYTAGEVATVLERIIDLARSLDEPEAEIQAVWGLGAAHFVAANLGRGRELAARASVIARECPSRRCEGHHLSAGTLMSAGDLAGARREFEAIIAGYDPARPSISAFGSDFGVFARAWLAHVLALQGDEEGAARSAAEAVAQAGRSDNPYNLALAHAYAAITHQIRRDPESVRTSAEAAIALCERYGFAYYGEWALALVGWVRVEEGRHADGIHLVETGLARLQAQGALIRRSFYLSLLAEAYQAAGEREAAAAVLDAAIATAEAHEDRWWLPELHRLRGSVSDGDVGRARVEVALAMARRHGSRLLERRAEASLATR